MLLLMQLLSIGKDSFSLAMVTIAVDCYYTNDDDVMVIKMVRVKGADNDDSSDEK